MLIQANRLTAAFAAPSHTNLRPQRAVASASAVETDTVTISKAARELLAAANLAPASTEAVSAVGLSAPVRSNGEAGLVNPYSSASGDYQAAVRKAVDNLQAAYNNKQMSDIQFKHDMAFYSRMAIVA